MPDTGVAFVEWPSDLVCIYAQVLPRLRATARRLGYALGLHGSMKRDLDLIAAPWVDEAVSAKALVDALAIECGGFVVGADLGGTWTAEHGTSKPHGREAFNICFGGKPFLDVSVMPRSAP